MVGGWVGGTVDGEVVGGFVDVGAGADEVGAVELDGTGEVVPLMLPIGTHEPSRSKHFPTPAVASHASRADVSSDFEHPPAPTISNATEVAAAATCIL